MDFKKHGKLIMESRSDETLPIHLFSFHELPSVKATDYEQVSVIINQLHQLVQRKELYDKSKNYLSQTLDFILTRSSFMMKDNTHQDVFESVLQVLKFIIKWFSSENGTVGYNEEIKQIMHMLANLINSSQPNSIKLIGCNCIANLIEFADVNSFDLLQMYEVALGVFKAGNDILALANFTHSALNRHRPLSTEICGWLHNVETQCVTYLSQNIRTVEVLQLLKCFALLYKKEVHQVFMVENSTTEILLQHLNLICAYFNDEDFRPNANYLLSIIISKSNYLYWTLQSIRTRIDNLPSDYNEWPYSENEIFFIIAYCLSIHSNSLMWSSKAILTAIDVYLVKAISFPRPEILKAILMLYSITSDDSSRSLFNCEKILFNILNSYKSLEDVLILHSAQITWLVQRANPALKARVIKHWLETEQDQDKIVNIIEQSQMGHHMVYFLLSNIDPKINIPIAKIVSHLTPDGNLSKAIDYAIPQVCNQPQVLGYLLQVNSQKHLKTVAEFQNNILVIFVALPFLVEKKSVRAACLYLRKLLNIYHFYTVTFEPDHILNFLQCLIAHAVGKDDETAVEALHLLVTLLTKHQIHRNPRIEDTINVPFVNILRGSDQRITNGLQVLLLTLNNAKSHNCLKVCQTSVCNLYAHLHSLVNQKNINLIFKNLKLLLLIEPHLSFSTLTSMFLKVVSDRYVNRDSQKSYDDFFKAFYKI